MLKSESVVTYSGGVFFNGLSYVCTISAGTCSFLPLILVPSTTSVGAAGLVAMWKARQGTDLTENLLQQQKNKGIITSATCFALLCSCLDGTTGMRVTLRGNGRVPGTGNASYSRETELDCAKINLHDTEWHH